MTILQFIEVTTAYFSKNRVDSPRLTAELMLGEVLHKKRMQLYLEFSAEVSDSVLDSLRPLVKRRAQGEPLQHVQGFADFHGDRIRVTPDVLIPRQETELLLDAALRFIDPSDSRPLADIGTGSGILARALARANPQVTVHAVDISPLALEVARSNVTGLSNVTFYEGNLLEPLPDMVFQLVVANLPYIPTPAMATLSREVQREPKIALDGGESGLDLIEALIVRSRGRTKHLALEIGDHQAERVKILLSEHGYLVAETIKDLCQVERIILGTYCG